MKKQQQTAVQPASAGAAVFSPLSWVVVEMHGKRTLGVVMTDIDANGEVQTFVDGNAYFVHETQLVAKDVSRERIVADTSLTLEDLLFEENKVQMIGTDAGFGPFNLINTVHHNSWQAASGDPRGWRVVRGLCVQEHKDDGGNTSYFKTHEPAKSLAMMMNAAISRELHAPLVARIH